MRKREKAETASGLNIPSVVVDMYLDAAGENNVASVLVSKGMHVKFDTVTASDRKPLETVSDFEDHSRECVYRHTNQEKTGFELVKHSVCVSRSCDREKPVCVPVCPFPTPLTPSHCHTTHNSHHSPSKSPFLRLQRLVAAMQDSL